MNPKDDTARARANTIKIIRAAVRLKHSINADDELNEILPRAIAKFDAAVARQQLPAPADIKKAVGL